MTFELPFCLLQKNCSRVKTEVVSQRLSLTVPVGDGEKGTGKTMTLCHVVHYCARQGWLVLHVPDGKSTGARCVAASTR